MANKAKAKEAESAPEEQPIVAETLEIQEVELPKVEVVEQKPIIVEQKVLTLSEKILKLLHGKSEFIKLNDLLRIELKQTAGMQGVNKALRTDLQKLVDEGVIVVKDNLHTQLGGFFYAGDSPITQFRTVLNVTIEAKLA